MSRIYAYERQPYRRELDVEVVGVGEADGRPFALLDDTLLYPEGGGQPADRGWLGGQRVVDVQRTDVGIRHVLEAPAAVGPAILILDWERRFDHMQQHTAQHLLTAVAADRFGWQTTSFHLLEEICDVELDAPAILSAELEDLEEAVAAEVRAARPVTARRVPPEEVATLEVRSRGLPAGHRGDVRLVEISGIDLNTCGGTHLASTAEIEAVKLFGTESRRGGTRLFWVAGGRVRRRLGVGEARLAELRALVGAADEELAGVVGLKLGQLKQASRRQKALAGHLADAVADGLVGRDGPLVEAHFDDADMGFLQRIARRFGASPREGLAFLTAEGEGGSCFVLAAGAESTLDVQEAGRRVAAALGGRGGGSGRLFQGKAASLARRTDALEALASSF